MSQLIVLSQNLSDRPGKSTHISPPASCRQQSGGLCLSSITASILNQRISQTLVTVDQTPARHTHVHLRRKLILPAHTSHVHSLALALRKNSNKKGDPSQGLYECSKMHSRIPYFFSEAVPQSIATGLTDMGKAQRCSPSRQKPR